MIIENDKGIEGYKTFLPGLVNIINLSFMEVGKEYKMDEAIKFGRCGYHFCANLEDTLRYFYNQGDIEICKVLGYGKIDVINDEYNGYYNLYASSHIKIIEKLDRKRVLELYRELAKNLEENGLRVARFMHYYPNLSEEEKLYIYSKKLTLY